MRVYNAQIIRFKTFLDSLPPEERDEYMDVINEIKGAFPERAMDALCANEKFAKMCSKHTDFVERKSAENPTFAFWSSYIDMVQILLLFVRATRESDWKLHLSTLQLMMPCFFFLLMTVLIMPGIFLHTGWKWSIFPSHILRATLSSVLKASGLSNVKVYAEPF